jgi:hypothetical protein
VKFDVDDPGHRAVLEAARAWGVAPSIFMGRVRNSTATQWVEWTEDDRSAALDLLAWEAALCPGCKHPLAETTEAENEERYSARVTAQCHRCTALEIAQDAAQNHPHPTSLLIGVELRPQAVNDSQISTQPVQ